MATKEQVKKCIETIAPLAAAEYKKGKKILPSVCIAQACCESEYLTSPKMVKANAVFGIKVGKNKVHFGSAWKDKAYSTKTKECYDGKTYTEITDMFRAYDTLQESVEDYYDMLCTCSRYKAAVGLTDARATITAIRNGGYATSPTYITTIMGIIDKYDLTQYDPVEQGAKSDGQKVKTYQKGKAVQLSKNFRSTEFDCRGNGCCSETPVDEKLVKVLQTVRDHFGAQVTVNCGYRCPKHNAEVAGASKTSRHMEGLAADIAIKGVHPLQIARFIETIPGFAGHVGCYTWDDRGGGFVHVDTRGKNSRGIYTDNNVNCDYIDNFSILIKKGSKGKMVKVVQRKLKSARLYDGQIDGIAGPGTEKGVSAWNALYDRGSAEWTKRCWDEAFPV